MEAVSGSQSCAVGAAERVDGAASAPPRFQRSLSVPQPYEFKGEVDVTLFGHDSAPQYEELRGQARLVLASGCGCMHISITPAKMRELAALLIACADSFPASEGGAS